MLNVELGTRSSFNIQNSQFQHSTLLSFILSVKLSITSALLRNDKSPMTESTPVALRRFTKFTAASTLFLIFAGAMVTSTGSGLAVPDWPLSYGMLFPPMVGGIFYEHGHRMIAAAVGLLTVIQALWLQFREPKQFVRRLGWISVVTVIVQGLLGGLTVIFLLPLPISVGHAALAEVFFCLNVAIAFFTSRTYGTLSQSHGVRTAGAGALVRPTTLLTGIVFLQVLVGAVMRHLGAGLAIPDFPLSFGRLIPELTSIGVAVNYTHRVGALVVTIVILSLARRILATVDARAMRSIYLALLAILSVQIVLGAFTVWSGKNEVITSVHVAFGAATLAVSLLLCLCARALAPAVEGERASAVGSEVPA